MIDPTVSTVQIEGDTGETMTIFVETKKPVDLLTPPFVPDRLDDDRESYGLTEDAIAKLKDVHGTIRAYAWYAIGAFKNLGGAEVEEINLKFGLKIGGKTGVPILTEGSAEANFEVSVKCKFPSTN